MKSRVFSDVIPRPLVKSSDVSKDSFGGSFTSRHGVTYQKTWFFIYTVTVVFALSLVRVNSCFLYSNSFHSAVVICMLGITAIGSKSLV